MYIYNILFATLLLVLSLLGSACHANETSRKTPTALPATVLGTWQVTDVLYDHGKSHWNQTRDDKFNIHAHLGRIFVLTPERITHNAIFGDPCDEPKTIVHRTTIAAVVNTSMSSRLFDEAGPTPKDFHLPLADDTPIDVLSVMCKDGRLYTDGLGNMHDGVGIRGVWFTILNDNQFVLRWRNETILILNRMPDNAKPFASFDCTKATTNVEKTICRSVALAAYDQSVANTYKHVLKYYESKRDTKNLITELKKSQKQWLKKRDLCGTSVTCLEEAMSNRILDLDREIAEYTYQRR